MPRTSTADQSAADVHKRPVGRPKLTIDPAQVAAVAVRLYDEQGVDGVSIESVADGLGVSRATLYRTVRSLDELHAILLENVIQRTEHDARTMLEDYSDALEALIALIRFQVYASVRMRNYVGVYFGWGLSRETYLRWRSWATGYERLWTQVVDDAVRAGYLESSDSTITTRLILGMVNWVSRWYRPNSGYNADQIADLAVDLVFPRKVTSRPAGMPATRRRRSRSEPS